MSVLLAVPLVPPQLLALLLFVPLAIHLQVIKQPQQVVLVPLVS
jgi:hypothetical protein